MKYKPYKNDTKAQAWTQLKRSGKYSSNSAILLPNTQGTRLVSGSFGQSCAATGRIKSYSVLLVRDCLAGLVTPAPVSSASISTSHSFPRFILLPPLPSWPLKLRPYKCTHTLHH